MSASLTWGAAIGIFFGAFAVHTSFSFFHFESNHVKSVPFFPFNSLCPYLIFLIASCAFVCSQATLLVAAAILWHRRRYRGEWDKLSWLCFILSMVKLFRNASNKERINWELEFRLVVKPAKARILCCCRKWLLGNLRNNREWNIPSDICQNCEIWSTNPHSFVWFGEIWPKLWKLAPQQLCKVYQ